MYDKFFLWRFVFQFFAIHSHNGSEVEGPRCYACIHMHAFILCMCTFAITAMMILKLKGCNFKFRQIQITWMKVRSDFCYTKNWLQVRRLAFGLRGKVQTVNVCFLSILNAWNSIWSIRKKCIFASRANMPHFSFELNDSDNQSQSESDWRTLW